jgi:tripeptide aminopeptidase
MQMNLDLHKKDLIDRFFRYLQIDTEADPNSTSQPSSLKQKDLGQLLVEELLQMGLLDAALDEFGYVYATIPANTNKNVPVICYCAHMDTSPDVSGRNVIPVLHENYSGGNIYFKDDTNLVLSPEEHPYLKQRIGDDIITASGNTLLGADDKAGIAIIMQLAKVLTSSTSVEHGKIRILFTPDEEIGRGVDAVDMEKLGADFGYTLDGGERGVLEGESFSADGVKITIFGISAHPGYAKDKLVSAIKAAAHFIELLPKTTWSPETTSGKQGFVHPLHMEGSIEKATVTFIIRDFETKNLADYEQKLETTLKTALQAFPGASYTFEVIEQYRNMREILDKNPKVMQLAEQAYRAAGLEPEIHSIRGGTDGSRLSFMGLPCPNIFTGEMAIHSKKEFVSVQDMLKSLEVILNLARLNTNN